MTVYYSVGTLSPTFISWNDKNIYFGVESRIDEHKNIKGLPEWNPVVQNYRCNSVSNETSLTLAFV